MPKGSSQTKQINKKPKWPVIIVLLIGVVFIPLTVFAVKYVIEIRTKALPTEDPKNLEITNIVDTSFSVSWTTSSQETKGYIKYSNTTDLKNIAYDKRDNNNKQEEYSVHYIDVSDLNANTTYYFVVYVGGTEYKNSDNGPYQVQTGSVIDSITVPQPIRGTIEDPYEEDEEVIVYLYAQNSQGISSKLSTLTQNKNYTFDLSNLRDSKLDDIFTDLDGSTLYITADGAGRGEGSVKTEIINLSSYD